MKYLLGTLALIAALLTGGAVGAATVGNPPPPSPEPRWLTAPCQQEDGQGCYWNAGVSGDGAGHSFYSMKLANGKLCTLYSDTLYGREHNYCS